MKLRSLKSYFYQNMLILCLLGLLFFTAQRAMRSMQKREFDGLQRNEMVVNAIADEVERIKACSTSYLKYGVYPFMQTEQLPSAKENLSRLINENTELFTSTAGLLLYSRIVDQTATTLVDTFFDEIYHKMDRPEIFDRIMYIESGFLVLQSEMTALLSEYLSYSSDQLEKINSRFERYNLLISTLFILLIIILLTPMVVTSRDIVKRFTTIESASEALSRQQWDTPDIELGKYQELTHTAMVFNDMKKIIRKDIEELQANIDLTQRLAEKTLETERQKRLIEETRYHLLQAQINPHFLFNTLNMIVRQIQLAEDRNRTANLLIATSSLLRKSIEIRTNTIPLSEELRLLDSYITIQKARLDRRIEFCLEVSDELPEMVIPPFTLQPLVENAILHGLKDKSCDGRIEIQVFADEDEGVYISVTDNGVGIEEKVIEKAMKEELKSHGLQNSISRLKLIYSNSDVVRIVRDNPGTGIIIHLEREAYHAQGPDR